MSVNITKAKLNAKTKKIVISYEEIKTSEDGETDLGATLKKSPKYEAHGDLVAKFDQLADTFLIACEFYDEKSENYQVNQVHFETKKGEDDEEYPVYRLHGYKVLSNGHVINMLTSQIDEETFTGDENAHRDFLTLIDELEEELQLYISGKKYAGKQLDMFEDQNPESSSQETEEKEEEEEDWDAPVTKYPRTMHKVG